MTTRDIESNRGAARCLAFAARAWAPFKYCLFNRGPSIWTLLGIFWRALFLVWIPTIGTIPCGSGQARDSSPATWLLAYVVCVVISAGYALVKAISGVFGVGLWTVFDVLDGPMGIVLIGVLMSMPVATHVSAGLIALAILGAVHGRIVEYFSEYSTQVAHIARLRVLYQLGIRKPAHVLATHPMHIEGDYDPALILFDGDVEKLSDAMRIHGIMHRDRMSVRQFTREAAFMRIEAPMFRDYIPHYGTVDLKPTDAFLAWYASVFRQDYITLKKEAMRRQTQHRSRPSASARRQAQMEKDDVGDSDIDSEEEESEDTDEEEEEEEDTGGKNNDPAQVGRRRKSPAATTQTKVGRGMRKTLPGVQTTLKETQKKKYGREL